MDGKKNTVRTCAGEKAAGLVHIGVVPGDVQVGGASDGKSGGDGGSDVGDEAGAEGQAEVHHGSGR